MAIREFFAVTNTSVYRLQAKGSTATATKIALHGYSNVGIGGTLEDGTRLAICRFLVMYTPRTARGIEAVSEMYWGGHSSWIVALFKSEAEAMACFANGDLRSCDPRWAEQTLQVVAEIGNNHPAFEVCRSPKFGLPLAVAAAPTS